MDNEEKNESVTEERSEEAGQYGDQQLRTDPMDIDNYNPDQDSDDPGTTNMATLSTITNKVDVDTVKHGKEDQQTLLEVEV